jgi:dTDP-4-dehydrorhamnose reductase
MKILLIGKDGQVGFALQKKLLLLGEVIGTNRESLDLKNLDSIKATIHCIKPDIIINTTGYTKVDLAEKEQELAYQINTLAPQAIAREAEILNIPFIHFSTDYVFDGSKKDSYLEIDQPNPLSIYAKTKWEGEKLVYQHRKHFILRVGWVFGIYGSNFLITILKLIQEKKSLKIVGDQWGAPTSVYLIADIIFRIIKNIKNNPDFEDFGTYHIASKGETNWYEYACYITTEAIQLGFKTQMNAFGIKKITSNEYFSLTKRPLNSRLNTEKIQKTFNLDLPFWQESVTKTLQEKIIK